MTPKRLRLIAQMVRREMRNASGNELAQELEEHAFEWEAVQRKMIRLREPAPAGLQNRTVFDELAEQKPRNEAD